MSLSLKGAYAPTHAEVTEFAYKQDLSRRGYCPEHPTVKVRIRLSPFAKEYNACPYCVEVFAKQMETASKDTVVEEYISKEDKEAKLFEEPPIEVNEENLQFGCDKQDIERRQLKRAEERINKCRRSCSICIAGATCAGKTCLFRRYAENKFAPVHDFTVGVDYARVAHNENIRLFIWDIAGTKSAIDSTETCFRRQHAYLICFNCKEEAQTSIEDALYFLHRILRYEIDNASSTIYFVGCKYDGNAVESFDKRTARSLVPAQYPIVYTSAKLPYNVDFLFCALLNDVYDDILLRSDSIHLEPKPTAKESEPTMGEKCC